MFCSLIFYCLSFSSCGDATNENQNSNKAIPTTQNYYDILTFFKGEILKLKAQDAGLEKEITLNGETETKQIPNVNWEIELSVFIENHINKPALAGKFTKDSTVQQNQILLSYSAIDENSDIRSLNIILDLQSYEPKSVSIQKRKKNLLYKTQSQFTYINKNKEKSFTIINKQDLKGLNETNFQVEGKILF